MGLLGKAAALLFAGLLLALSKLLFDNIFYAAIMRRLKSDLDIDEGDMIAMVAANLIPILASIILIAIIYRLAIHHVESRAKAAVAEVKPLPKRRRRPTEDATERKLEQDRKNWRELRNIGLFGVICLGLLISISSIMYAVTTRSSLIDVLYTRPTTDPTPDQFGLNVFYRNIGNAAAVGPHSVYRFENLSSEMTPAIADAAAISNLELLKHDRQSVTSEIQAGSPPQHTTAHVSRQWIDSNKAGTTLLYLFYTIEYRDTFLSKGSWRVTEACWRLWPNGSMMRCPSHNRAFVR
jgi:hypothetical protein